ncbi:hypothetical protein V7I35_26450 [Klebsiella michiganensis]|uniref:hypothetical protein n=1 Tax=Klebsiella TaxID=570 RepID=UPI0011E4BEEE|nr:hypothetical protein [Klebsiella grimontii]TYF92240.1 hypothetical protein DJ542_12995 [Klebsiella grimontii]
MAFTLVKSVTVLKQCPSLCNATLAPEQEDITITVSVTSLESLSGAFGTVNYSITPEGGAAGRGMFDFTYSGTGNPIDEAEAALKASLS